MHSKADGSRVLLLLAIADWANDLGIAYPSIETLAKKARMTPRSVINNVKALEEIGELRVMRQASSYGTNIYQLIVPGLEGATFSPLEIRRMLSLDNPTVPPDMVESENSGLDFSPDSLTTLSSTTESKTSEESGENHEPELSPEDQYLGGLRSKISPEEYELWKIGVVPALWQGKVDVGHFPEEVRTVLERFHRIWQAPIPHDGKVYSDWITGGRDLMRSYLEFGPELMDLVFLSGDTDEINVGRPGSIVQFVANKYGELRRKSIRPEQLPKLVDQARQIRKLDEAISGDADQRKQIELDARAKATK